MVSNNALLSKIEALSLWERGDVVVSYHQHQARKGVIIKRRSGKGVSG